MRLISGRNSGCRIKDVRLHGKRCLILENDMLSVVVLPDNGGDITEFVYKPTDTDFLWRSPAGYDLLAQRVPGHAYVGGWFECFPNAGAACVSGGNPVPQYGDAKDLPWDCTVLEDNADRLSVRLAVKSNVLPLRLEKTLSMVRGEASLLIEETAENRSDQPVGFTWGHHPNLGMPFLDENCEISLPGGRLYDWIRKEDGTNEDRPAGEWPWYKRDGAVHDLRVVPKPEDGVHDLLFVRDLPGNTAVVRNRKTGLGFELSWDPTVFRHMLLWRAFDTRDWRQMFGHLYILCFLIKSSHCSEIDGAATRCEQIVLPSNGKLNTWVRAAALPTCRKEWEP